MSFILSNPKLKADFILLITNFILYPELIVRLLIMNQPITDNQLIIDNQPITDNPDNQLDNQFITDNSDNQLMMNDIFTMENPDNQLMMDNQVITYNHVSPESSNPGLMRNAGHSPDIFSATFSADINYNIPRYEREIFSHRNLQNFLRNF
jgi:hypothetical protein